MPKDRKGKNNWDEKKEVLVGVVIKTAVTLLILVSAWTIDTTARWLFTRNEPCPERTETVISVGGVPGTPGMLVSIHQIEERCKTSR